MVKMDQVNEIDKQIAKIDKQIKTLYSEKDELLKKKKLLKLSSKSDTICDNTDYKGKDFPWSLVVEKSLHEKFKLKDFRSLQLQTINATLNKCDCILIKPTGGGKSLCYQLPSLITGFTLVISPLVSLMHDQLMISEKFGIPCVSLDANCPVKLQNEIYKSMQNDPVDNVTYKLIYVTPEKISKSKKLMQSIEKAYADNRIARVVIDEIHCCSQWGHDFRPDYKQLHIFKSLYPKMPILGLTATASDTIVNDIKDMLGMSSDCLVFRDSYNRPNLFYDVRILPTEATEVQEVCNLVKTRFNEQSGIVYCFTQKDCEKVTNDLMISGVKACTYHANMGYENRKEVHEKWLNEQCKVIVATIAFGMGIDKPNVRFVIHLSMSKSLENYYQESGRAGRDGKRADCILFWKLSEYFKIGSNLFTEKVGIANLNIMCRYSLEEKSCKRASFAAIFNEKHSDNDCKKMCSNCADTESQITNVDITGIFTTAVTIIENVEKSKNPKITGNKLVGELNSQMGTFRAQLLERFPGLDNKLFFDKALCHLVLRGYLKSDFHFGSFSNFTYIMIGNKKTASGETIEIPIRISKQNKLPVKRAGEDCKGGNPSKLSKR